MKALFATLLLLCATPAFGQTYGWSGGTITYNQNRYLSSPSAQTGTYNSYNYSTGQFGFGTYRTNRHGQTSFYGTTYGGNTGLQDIRARRARREARTRRFWSW